MGRMISFFSEYSMKENRVTNYCLLLLKMIYEYNIEIFSEILSAITGNEMIASFVGVSFSQQEKKERSVLDGLIMQKSFCIFIETKNYDWFYDDQIESHLESLDKQNHSFKVLLAIGNFEDVANRRFDMAKQLCAGRYRNSIIFRALSFEDLVNVIDDKKAMFPQYLANAASEFRSFLNEGNWLPDWKFKLDVVNCATIPDDVLKYGVYMCPATRGSYSHARCKYFGMYKDKKVNRVAEIEAVIDVTDKNTGCLKWNNSQKDKSELIKTAVNKVNKLRQSDIPVRTFILGPQYETDFVKDSFGGMRGSKQYFNLCGMGVDNVKDLADKIRGKKWSEFLK